jgi:hypothetical protein
VIDPQVKQHKGSTRMIGLEEIGKPVRGRARFFVPHLLKEHKLGDRFAPRGLEGLLLRIS